MTNLRKLLAKATPDYWYADNYGDSSFVRSHNGEDIGEIWSNMKDTDAALICAMKNALPGLLDKVERYEAALRRAVELMNAASNFIKENRYEEGTTFYDGAECDGYCMLDDLNIAIGDCVEALEGAGHAE